MSLPELQELYNRLLSPLLGHNEDVPNLEDWMRSEMTTFYSAGNVGDLNEWSVSSVPENKAGEIALALIEGLV